MPGYGQAHRRVAHPHLRQDFFQRPFDGFKVRTVFEVANEQQSLTVQCGTYLLVILTIYTVYHHVHWAPADLAYQFGVMGAHRNHFGGLAKYALLPATIAPAVERIERAQPKRQAVMAGAAHHRFECVFAEHVGKAAGL
ncbi:hypothetical protein D3C81_1539040 [compost metagenome]